MKRDLYRKLRWWVVGLFFGCGPLLPMCSSFSPSCSCDPTKFEKPLPVEIDVLLPKFDCAQAPTSAFCCIPDNPVTLWDEGKCCEAFKTIESNRLAGGMTLADSAKTPMTDAEAETYSNACCNVGDNAACCQEVMKKGGDLSVCAGPGLSCDNFPEPFKSCCLNNDWGPCGNQPPPPGDGDEGGGGLSGGQPEVECGCVDPEDRISKDEATGAETCFPIKKDGTPAKGYCQMKDPSQGAALAVMTKAQVLLGANKLEWHQVSGSQILKADAAGGVTPLAPQGGEFKGVTIFAEGVKTLDSEPPPDRVEFTLPFPKYPEGKNYEDYGMMLALKDVNGVNLNASTAANLRLQAQATGGGCSGGCSLILSCPTDGPVPGR